MGEAIGQVEVEKELAMEGVSRLVLEVVLVMVAIYALQELHLKVVVQAVAVV